MSGHNKWSSIKHKKGAADAKRGKVFTKLIKEITVAARNGGADSDSNPRLRTAIASAKAANMPNDNITRAIKKGTGEIEGVNYEEVTYEGYGPGGTAVLVEAMTDNKNRTIAEIRSVFGKSNGNLGANGCVAWMFQRKGVITIEQNDIEEDKLMELVLESGADDFMSEGDLFLIYTETGDLEKVRTFLESKNIKMQSAEISMIPSDTKELTGKDAENMLKLMEKLEDHDDVQKVHSNFDISEEEIKKFMS
jgi:YebC/PmpR family DNA-binding regulatory protein